MRTEMRDHIEADQSISAETKEASHYVAKILK